MKKLLTVIFILFLSVPAWGDDEITYIQELVVEEYYSTSITFDGSITLSEQDILSMNKEEIRNLGAMINILTIAHFSDKITKHLGKILLPRFFKEKEKEDIHSTESQTTKEAESAARIEFEKEINQITLDIKREMVNNIFEGLGQKEEE